MTDNEIVKALEYCYGSNEGACKDCPRFEHKDGCVTMGDTLDVIHRQKAEIENMQKTIFRKEDLMHMLCSQKQVYYDELVSAKAEIERLQKECEITRAYIHNNGLEWGLVSHLEFYKNQRAEAINEFAERLKTTYLYDLEQECVLEEDIDHLVEKMTGELT